jgi:hypothetical protein
MPLKTSHFMNSLTYEPNPSMIYMVSIFHASRERGTYIVVIPDIQLGDLAIGIRKGLSRVPADVVLQVVVVTLLAETLRKRMVLPLLGVADVGPVVERTGDADAVVIDLVAAANPVIRQHSINIPSAT